MCFMSSYGEIGQQYLGDPLFAPVMDELNRRKAVAHTHPFRGEMINSCCPMAATWASRSRPKRRSPSRASSYNDTATRCPDIRFIWSHGGGTAPYITSRLGATNGPDGKPNAQPRRRCGSFYYDTAQAFNRVTLATFTKVVPNSHILFGTDYPIRRMAGTVARGLAELRASRRRNLQRNRARQRARIVSPVEEDLRPVVLSDPASSIVFIYGGLCCDGFPIAALLFRVWSVAHARGWRRRPTASSPESSAMRRGRAPGVTVVARNVDTGAMRNVVTEGDGRFRLAALPPGRYEAEGRASGLRGGRRCLTSPCTTGTEVSRNITMQVQGLNESVTVTGEAADRRGDQERRLRRHHAAADADTCRSPPASRWICALLMPGTSQDAVRARKANSNVGAGAFTNGSALLVDGVLEQGRQHRRAAAGLSAVGHPGVQGAAEPVARRVRLDGGRRRCRWPPRAARTSSTAKGSSSTGTRRSTRLTRSRRPPGRPSRISAVTSMAARSAGRSSGTSCTSSRRRRRSRTT